MEDVPVQLVESWAFNLTNPEDYLSGGDAHVHEMGVYAWNFLPLLENIEVANDILEFDLFNKDVQFNKEKSCDTCDMSEEVYSQFTPYSALMGGAKSEAVVLLSMACSPTQIGLIQSTNPNITYCDTSEMKTATMCRCCSAAPTANATTCSTLASTSSKSGGLLSWISMYDGGYELSSTPNANFALSSGDYTGLIRRSNVKEMALGHPSALIGFFKTNLAITNGDTATISGNAKNTNDLKDACTPLGYCPTMTQLLQQILANPTPANMMAVLKSIDCTGLIPSAYELEHTHGLENERAQELRYLEGVNCRPYGLTLAISTMIKAQTAAGSTHTCADSSHSLPCCMSSFSAPAFGGSGSAIGCMGWANGFIQARNLYTVEEARLHILPAPHAKSFTACADESLRYRQEMWHGRDEWNSWFTPDSYVYPNMNWADFSVVSGALTGTLPGQYTEYDIEGTQMAIRKGKGITTGFLEYDISDGEPQNKEESIWAPFRLDALKFEHVESFEYQELQAAHMRPYIQTNFTDAEHEERQRKGEMPYPNQKNVAHSKGVPIVLGYPNFYKVNEEILTQSDNTARVAPPGSEIQLFRTRDGYGPESAQLENPVRMTTATLEQFAADYEGDMVIEPATGVTLDASVVTMISNFIWQCDPRLDTTCGLVASAYNAADPLCYNFGNGKQMPCSATNVFTPKVHGGKVMPVWWLRSLAIPSDDLVDDLLAVSDTRYALSISVLVLPIIFAVGFLFAVYQLVTISASNHMALQKQNSAQLESKYVVEE